MMEYMKMDKKNKKLQLEEIVFHIYKETSLECELISQNPNITEVYIL